MRRGAIPGRAFPGPPTLFRPAALAVGPLSVKGCPMRNTPSSDALDAADRSLIERLRDGIAITEAPFAALSATLGLTEDEITARLARLREIGAVTRFGPFLDAVAMGGACCLCAMEVPPGRLDAVVTLVNDRPEVVHNHQRDHRLNLWFVLACERSDDIQATAREIGEKTGIEVLLFPKEEEFFADFRGKA